MKTLNRRQFMGRSSQLLGGAALGGWLTGCGAPTETAPAGDLGDAPAYPWKFAVCNEIMKDWDWERQCRFSKETGYMSLEVAPFTLGQHVDEISAERRKEMRDAAAAAGVEVIGLHWLLVTPEWLHFTTPEEETRVKTWDYMKKLADLCADLGGKVMIFGSPKQRGSRGITREQATENLVLGLKEVGPHLAERNVKILVEALDHNQTDVVNTVKEAVEVVKAVGHPNVTSMFDFHNTLDETEPLDAIVRQYFPYIEHVHIQEMDGSYLGAGTAREDFIPALKALKELNFDKWVSLEVFNFEPGPEKIMQESMKTLQEMMTKI